MWRRRACTRWARPRWWCYCSACRMKRASQRTSLATLCSSTRRPSQVNTAHLHQRRQYEEIRTMSGVSFLFRLRPTAVNSMSSQVTWSAPWTFSVPCRLCLAGQTEVRAQWQLWPGAWCVMCSQNTVTDSAVCSENIYLSAHIQQLSVRAPSWRWRIQPFLSCCVFVFRADFLPMVGFWLFELFCELFHQYSHGKQIRECIFFFLLLLWL